MADIGYLWFGVFVLCGGAFLFSILELPNIMNNKFERDLAIEKEKTKQEIERTKQAQLKRDGVSLSK